jgi:phospholipid-binding lipoprotein MlaA
LGVRVKLLRPALCLLLISSTLGCSTTSEPRDPRDPWEGFNRTMFEFNDDLDQAVLKPVAQGYKKVMPTVVDDGITNFFDNLDDFVNLFNNLLQLKIEAAVQDFGRITWNTTVGVLGFFDVASSFGFPKHDEDFGQTLGYWGVPSGPYLVLPLLGPSTLRDAPSRLVDRYVQPIRWYDPEQGLRWGLLALQIVDRRADLLAFEELADEIAFDRYVTLRDAFLQRREYLVNDGEISEEGDPLLEELQLLDESGEI